MRDFRDFLVTLALAGAVPTVLVAGPSAAVAAAPAAAPATAPASAPMTVKGTVLEVKDVDMYTYLRLKTADGETWAAVTRAPARVGDMVSIVNASVMTNFESRSLQRKFDRIVFGSLAGGAPAAAGATGGNPHAAAPGGAAGAAGNPHGSASGGATGAAKGATAADIKISKATGPNAYTVAEVVAKKGTLKDKPVVIRGRVVKFTSQVMGKNWIHLRDGSGSASDGSNDLVVTTQDSAAVGDVVTVKGTARTNIDIGSGYAYAVMVDTATLQK